MGRIARYWYTVYERCLTVVATARAIYPIFDLLFSKVGSDKRMAARLGLMMHVNMVYVLRFHVTHSLTDSTGARWMPHLRKKWI